MFVYDALLEAFKSGDTAVSCVDFRKRFMELSRLNPQTGKLRLLEEYEVRHSLGHEKGWEIHIGQGEF